jgi:hypothetical protein
LRAQNLDFYRHRVMSVLRRRTSPLSSRLIRTRH